MHVQSTLGDLRLPHRNGAASARHNVTLGVRPDEIDVKTPGECSGSGASGVVVDRSFLGNVVEVRVRLADSSLALIEAKLTEGQYALGERIKFGCRASRVKVFTE